MRTRLNICSRKTRYAAEAEAITAAAQAEITLRHYRCDRCRWFHLTGRPRANASRGSKYLSYRPRPELAHDSSEAAAGAEDDRPAMV